MIHALQIICGLCWLVPVVLYVPALYRVLFTCRWNGIDAPRVVVWFTGLSQCLFVGRWLVWRDAISIMTNAELQAWAGMYALSSLCALGFVYVIRVRAKAQ